MLAHRAVAGAAFMAFAIASIGLLAVIGENFFPYVDAGQMRLHVRCPTGTRIEEAAAIFSSIESEIRVDHSSRRTRSILDNIWPVESPEINLAFSDSITNGNGDGEILDPAGKPDHCSASSRITPGKFANDDRGKVSRRVFFSRR